MYIATHQGNYLETGPSPGPGKKKKSLRGHRQSQTDHAGESAGLYGRTLYREPLLLLFFLNL